MTATKTIDLLAPETVDRVARALFDHEWDGQPGLEGEWRISRECWRAYAAAALRAMEASNGQS